MGGSMQEGMGALPHPDGVSFRVWAPHADAVFVTGSFNDWSEDATDVGRGERHVVRRRRRGEAR